jgi:hypothetical protein
VTIDEARRGIEFAFRRMAKADVDWAAQEHCLLHGLLGAVDRCSGLHGPTTGLPMQHFRGYVWDDIVPEYGGSFGQAHTYWRARVALTVRVAESGLAPIEGEPLPANIEAAAKTAAQTLYAFWVVYAGWKITTSETLETLLAPPPPDEP